MIYHFSKDVNAPGVSTVSFTGRFLQILRTLQWSSLPVQLSFRPNAVWCVSYQSLSRSWYTDLDYGLYCLPELELGLMVDVTGQQGMLTPPRHLIPSLVFPGVRVNLRFSCTWSEHWFWLWNFPFTWLDTLILSVEFSIYLTGHTDFVCGIFHLPDWIHWFWLLIFALGLMVGVTGQKGMLTPPTRHLIPPLVYPEVCVWTYS
jgi:hypothetical protein